KALWQLFWSTIPVYILAVLVLGATLYASSRSAQGTAGPDFRLEMEGLQYSEIPMLAGSNPQLMQQALGAVRNDYSLA
ncbi:penicillin-binding protein activator, partial [Klebsiella pneumoniae]|uniref:penicillin-binding protein activator n=1 Tax=Klebsiella pneumoniae TaxID=573 RepID=UPI001F08013B